MQTDIIQDIQDEFSTPARMWLTIGSVQGELHCTERKTVKYHRIIWDFDGTLFDTYPALNRSIQRAAADLGAEVSSEQIARLLSQTLALCVETLVAEHSFDAELFRKRIDGYHAQATLEEKPPIPGAIEACQRIMAAGGENYIFTHRDHESMGELLKWYGVSDLFVDRMSVADGFPRKPDPAGFLGVLKKHNLPPDDVLCVGDRALDVIAAREAGIAGCLFAPEPDPLATPEYFIRDFADLPGVLGLD